MSDEFIISFYSFIEITGEIDLIDNSYQAFAQFSLTPLETRQYFLDQGWKTIVAFQTRNVPHRGHEYLQKEALKQTDGLFIQPIIGKKKLRDFKDEYIVASYQTLINQHFPKEKTLLGVLPIKMNYVNFILELFVCSVKKRLSFIKSSKQISKPRLFSRFT